MKSNYSANITVTLGKLKRINIELGPYTRKRDLIRGMERTLPKNFKLEEGYISIYDEYGYIRGVEEISNIIDGKIFTYVSNIFLTADGFEYHTYKFNN